MNLENIKDYFVFSIVGGFVAFLFMVYGLKMPYWIAGGIIVFIAVVATSILIYSKFYELKNRK
ncbi:hypothetical protein RFK12_10925 [Streptococcus suis]|uniref:hypothetical protein n=1 Tax=Streptococcus suis TaxID=1307 RepID=UPI002AAD2D8F|nr:hypothetical protein [Streptococcus suis]